MLPRPFFHTAKALLGTRAFVDPDLIEGQGRHGRIGRLVRYLEATRHQRYPLPGEPHPVLWYWLHLHKIAEAYMPDGTYFASVATPAPSGLPMMQLAKPPAANRETLKALGFKLR